MKLVAFVLSTIPLLIQYYSTNDRETDKQSTLESLKDLASVPKVDTYDFIVVGGGTAGCVIASRLSEKYSVLLLENGGPPVPATQVPFYVQYTGYDIETNYQFPSVPQKYAAQSSGGVIVSSLGKMLGGSGSHNDMVHNRGSPLDFDNYARISNDDSWNYTNILQYFKKSENFIGQLFTGENQENYGHDGPVVVDTDTPPFLPKWFQAGAELGFKVGDPNGYQVESFTPMAKAIYKGQRSSTYNQLLKPRMGNPQYNLTVLPYSFVTQVLIDGNKKAYGVAYERHSIPQVSIASKEVIISAGAYSSPMLLMKSGVGPRDQLEAAEIPIKHELSAVGKNLQDHVMVMLGQFTWNSSALPFVPRMPDTDEEVTEMLQKYHETGEGIIGHLQEGPQAFIVSSRAKQDGEGAWPDIQLNFDPMCPAPSGNDLPVSCSYVWNTRPKFRGTVDLNTTAYKNGVRDDMSLALIDFKVFEGESQSDVDVLLEAIQYQLSILNTTTLRSLGAEYSETPYPACSSHQFMSEDYWRCFIAQTAYTTFHSVGTCSLGSVVDSQFRVQGISSLRVADASVFPTVPNANLNAPVIALAEKAADDIMKAWP